MLKQSSLSPKTVLSVHYFLYFGVLGIFLPFFNLYCYHLGFSGFQIGVISALRTAMTVLFPLLWGALADRFRMRKPLFIGCSLISTVIWSLYLTTVNFWLMLIITLFYGIFYAPLIAFLEAFAMDMLGSEKKRYGRLRVWGSIAFISVVIGVGNLTDVYPIKLILILILAGSMLQSLFAPLIPDQQRKKTFPDCKGAAFLTTRPVLIFLISAFLMLVSHGAYYGFFSIHLETLGYGKAFIGIAWALASASEIGVMIFSDALFGRFAIRRVLMFSFAVAVVRWAFLSWANSAAVILLTQILHAATYGAFHIASILYIDQMAPESSKTLGQAVNNAVTYGLGITAGFFLNGYLYEVLGSFSLFWVSSLLALIGGLVFAIGLRSA